MAISLLKSGLLCRGVYPTLSHNDYIGLISADTAFWSLVKKNRLGHALTDKRRSCAQGRGSSFFHEYRKKEKSFLNTSLKIGIEMSQKTIKAFVCWSGGKESCLALHRVSNYEVLFLVNMTSENGKHSRTHGISSNLLKLQSEAIGIPIIQRKSSWENYEEEFRKIICQLKTKDVNTGIFGDIDLQEHRDWVERVCYGTGINSVLPLWQEGREKLLKEFIQVGFNAIVVATNSNFLGKEWLGRAINEEFVADLKNLGNIDLCGEKGEYHTFVYDGPVFKKSIEFIVGKKILKDKHWFLELKLKK